MARILVADDDSMVRGVLRAMLERAGHEVEEAANGDEAVEKYNASPPDLLITDIVMPGKEGVAVILEIRKAHPRARIIAISGGGRFAAENYLELAATLGAARTFPKPVEREQILGAVEELLASGA